MEEAMEYLKDANPEALLADGFEPAFIGYTSGFRASPESGPVAAYDVGECLKLLMDRDGMDYTEAREYLEFNLLYAFVGVNGPIFIETVEK